VLSALADRLAGHIALAVPRELDGEAGIGAGAGVWRLPLDPVQGESAAS
jgi:hypothetical protein